MSDGELVQIQTDRLRKGICDPYPAPESISKIQARKWGYRCRGRAVKQGTCGIFAFPSFHHDCRRERLGLPTTPYAVVATGALLFGASPTLTDSGVTSPMVDCWAGTTGVSSSFFSSATAGVSTLSAGSADSWTVAGASFFSLGSFLPPALETVRAREPKMLLRFSFLGAGVSSFFSSTGAAEVSATGTAGSTPLATTGAGVSSVLGSSSVLGRVGAVSTAGDLAFSLLPKNLPKEKCSFSLTGVTGLAVSVLGASSLASVRGASVVASAAGATAGVSSAGLATSGTAAVSSFFSTAGTRSASFFS